jgi:hypothetical protein
MVERRRTLPVIPASGVSSRAGTQGHKFRSNLEALGPGYCADTQFRDDSNGGAHG